MPRRAQAATAILLLATPVSAWWSIGDLSENIDKEQADYAFQPPHLSGPIQLALGAGALVLAVGALAVLLDATRRRVIDVRWWGVIGPFVAFGIYAGFAYRVMTAAVGGANIGAGMVIFAAPTVLLTSIAISAWNGRALQRRSHERPEYE
jgi:hypothetical protein